jgi:lipoyl(octanoyl) transferase
MTARPDNPIGRDDVALQVYLLGTLDFDSALRFQRRLHYDVTGDRRQAALVVCEHLPAISVGRAGSYAHLYIEPEELRTRGWPLRWVNRAGGCLLHVPGQLAVYPILPLDRLGLSIETFVHRLGGALHDVLDDFSIAHKLDVTDRGVWSGGRLVAAIGAAVHDWVSYYGAYFNVSPDLEPFRLVHSVPDADAPMTSLVRERRGPVRPSLVRQRLVEHFAARFGFARVALFSDHPALAGCVQRSTEVGQQEAPYRLA